MSLKDRSSEGNEKFEAGKERFGKLIKKVGVEVDTVSELVSTIASNSGKKFFVLVNSHLYKELVPRTLSILRQKHPELQNVTIYPAFIDSSSPFYSHINNPPLKFFIKYGFVRVEKKAEDSASETMEGIAGEEEKEPDQAVATVINQPGRLDSLMAWLKKDQKLRRTIATFARAGVDLQNWHVIAEAARTENETHLQEILIAADIEQFEKLATRLEDIKQNHPALWDAIQQSLPPDFESFSPEAKILTLVKTLSNLTQVGVVLPEHEKNQGDNAKVAAYMEGLIAKGKILQQYHPQLVEALKDNAEALKVAEQMAMTLVQLKYVQALELVSGLTAPLAAVPSALAYTTIAQAAPDLLEAFKTLGGKQRFPVLTGTTVATIIFGKQVFDIMMLSNNTDIYKALTMLFMGLILSSAAGGFTGFSSAAIQGAFFGKPKDGKHGDGKVEEVSDEEEGDGDDPDEVIDGKVEEVSDEEEK